MTLERVLSLDTKHELPEREFYEITFQTAKLNELISSRLVEHLNTDLTKIQIALLIEINAKQPLSIRELSNNMNMNYGNTSRQCKILEEKKYIIRIRDEEDERFVQLFIDDSGRNVIVLINQWFKHFFDQVHADFSENEWVAMEKYLNRYKQLINNAINLLEGDYIEK